MKCSKCGEECRDGQAFCLKCGSPIDEVRDLDSVAEDISNDIEYFMANTGKLAIPNDKSEFLEEDTEDEDMDFPEDMDVSDYLPVDEIRKSVHNEPDKEEIWLPEEDDDLDEIPDRFRTAPRKKKPEQKQAPKKRSSTPERRPDKKKTTEPDRKKKKKGKTGTILGSLAVVLVVAVVIGAAYMLIFGRDNAKFNQYYENAQSYYDKESWQAAVSEFIRADNAANTVEQHTKAKEMLWKSYEKMEGKEAETITVLEALIGLNGDEVSYYEALLLLYQKTDNAPKIENLMAKVKGTEIGEKLEAYDFATPVASVQEGEYNEPITVELTSLSGNTIYYTKNGKDPTEKSKVYKKPLVFGKNGEFTLKAIAINAKGIKSDIMTVKYKINAITTPEIKPASGDYTEIKQITIDVPDGSVAYYTTDGSTPDKNSKKYEGPFDMPVGNTIVSAVIYNSADVASEVAQAVYNLVPYRAYSYNAALDQLKNQLLAAGIIENVEGEFSDDTKMEFSYVETKVIERKEYYIIITRHKSTQVYAVSCSDGTVYRAESQDDTYKLKQGVK